MVSKQRGLVNYEGIIRVTFPDGKVNGANMGPTWVLSAPDGPHVGHMNLANRDIIVFKDVTSFLKRYQMKGWSQEQLPLAPQDLLQLIRTWKHLMIAYSIVIL